jgi:hypothetical protein
MDILNWYVIAAFAVCVAIAINERFRLSFDPTREDRDEALRRCLIEQGFAVEDDQSKKYSLNPCVVANACPDLTLTAGDVTIGPGESATYDPVSGKFAKTEDDLPQPDHVVKDKECSDLPN